MKDRLYYWHAIYSNIDDTTLYTQLHQKMAATKQSSTEAIKKPARRTDHLSNMS